MDQQLKVIITADASGVGPAVAEATAAVSASADQIAVAQQKATAASKYYQSALIELNAVAASTGPGQAAAAKAIAEAEEAAAVARAELEALTATQVKNTASTEANTAAQAADTKVTYNRMEAMGSARVMMGEMDGSMGMMAGGLARLAAGSQVLGPLMQSMIPVAIMAAGVFLLYDLGKAIYKAFDIGGEAARAYQKAVDAVDESTKTFVDSTALEADKVEAMNAKLEHKPNPNAAKEAIDEAADAADKMGTKLDAIIDKEQKMITMQGATGSWAQRAFTNESTAQQEDVDLAQHAHWVVQANTLEQQLGESKSFVTKEQQRLNELESQQVALDLARNSSIEARIGLWVIGASQHGLEIEQLQDIIAQENRVTQGIQNQIRVRDDQTKHEELTGEGKAGKEGRTATDNLPEQIAQKQIELTHAKDGELSADQKIVEEMNKQIALNDLKAKTSKEGTAAERDTLRVIEDQIAVDKAFTALDKLAADEKKKADDAAKKSQADALRQQDEDLKTVDDQLVKQHKAQVDAARDKAELAIQSAALDFELSQEEIRAAEQSGRMSHKVAEQKLQDALRLKEQQTSVARQEEMGVLKPGAFEEDTRAYKKLQDQMVLEAKRGALERERITEQEATRLEKIYKKVSTTFNQDFDRAFNEWITKSKSAGDAFNHMLGQMELQVIDFVAEWILQLIEAWAKQKINNAQQAASAVGLAGANMVASYAAAPYPIDMGAPAAGAGAAASAAKFAAATTMDTGGMMPHMGFAFNASGSPERVLSPSQTHNFESLVNNGGSRSAVLHQTNNYGGAPTKEMHEAQTAHTINRLKSMLRPEAFA